MSQRITVAIVCHDEGESIFPCITSVLAQRKTQLLSEILIIDSSEDGHTSRLVLKRFAGEERIRSVLADEDNIGRSRALAVELARERLVAFVDADCVVARDWLQKFSEAYRTHSSRGTLAGVGGSSRLSPVGTTNRMINRMLDMPYFHGGSPQAWVPTIAAKVDHLATSNALFSKEALLKVGNFSTNIPVAGEDVEIGRRLQQAGYAMWLCPEPVVVHNCSSGLRQWLRRMYRFGYMQIDTFGMNVLRLRKLPQTALALALLTLVSLFWATVAEVLLVYAAAILLGLAVNRVPFLFWVASAGAYAAGVYVAFIKEILSGSKQSFQRLQARYGGLGSPN